MKITATMRISVRVEINAIDFLLWLDQKALLFLNNMATLPDAEGLEPQGLELESYVARYHPKSWLSEAFLWCNSQEGREFWDKVDEDWRKYLNSFKGEAQEIVWVVKGREFSD